MTDDERSQLCSQFILPGLGLPTLAPPPLVQLVSASTSQSQDCNSIQSSKGVCFDSPFALPIFMNALSADAMGGSSGVRCPERAGRGRSRQGCLAFGRLSNPLDGWSSARCAVVKY